MFEELTRKTNKQSEMLEGLFFLLEWLLIYFKLAILSANTKC